MDTVTYPDQHVAHFIAEHFVPARVRVKDDPQLVKEYFVSWTPNVVIADENGKVHYRIEGFHHPHEFVAKLSLGAGRYHLNRQEFDRAAERFEEVSQRHAGTDAGAEALYWLGVAKYKQSHDPAQLRESWQRLAREHPDNEWTRRSEVP
jgi:tetratricopeptide (TPR) repeat protein